MFDDYLEIIKEIYRNELYQESKLLKKNNSIPVVQVFVNGEEFFIDLNNNVYIIEETGGKMVGKLEEKTIYLD